jgi:acetolactate synthase-1/2/3 large subunit
LAGDGSIMMNLQELATISGKKMPIKIFVLNNNGYHSIRQTQKNYFSDNQIGFEPENGVWMPDFCKIAAGFDIPYYKLDKLESIKEVYEKIMSTEGPVLCEVMLNQYQDFSPKLSSRKNEDGTMTSSKLEDMSPFLDKEELVFDYEYNI